MSAETRAVPRWRPPTRGYMLNLVMACAGITFLVIALGSEIRLRAGLDVAGASDHEGVLALLFSGFIIYAFRLIFWSRIPPLFQNLMRGLLSLILCAELVLAVVVIYLVAMQGHARPPGGPGDTFAIVSFTAMGVLCQISTVVWLLRYRRE